MLRISFTWRTTVSAYHETLDYHRARYQDFCGRMVRRGMRLIERGLWYVSAAHTAEDIATTLATADAVLMEMAGH